MTKTIERAIRKVSQTTCRYKVGAIGFDNSGDIIDITRNTPRFNKKGGGIHAEMEMMRRHGDRLKRIVIFRVTDGGSIRRMDPCEACLEKATELGIGIISITETDMV